MKKNIFITGAASGIGKKTAGLFVKRGWYVGMYDINESKLIEIQKEFGSGQCCYRKLDVKKFKEVESAMAFHADQTGGAIDVLFNCAGVFDIGKTELMPHEHHEKFIDVNVRGVLNCTLGAFKYLKNAEKGCVINMASGSSIFGIPYFTSYSASKFWVRGFTESLNMEWRKYGILVCDIVAPAVDTPMIEKLDGKFPLKDFKYRMDPEKVAEAVWKATKRHKVHWPVGVLFSISYWIGKYLPYRLIRKNFHSRYSIIGEYDSSG